MPKYPDLPFIVEVHDMWSLKEDREVREACRYISAGGDDTFDIKEALTVASIKEATEYIAAHFNRNVAKNYYYRPVLHSRTMEEHEILREWYRANRS